ncbi:orotate phosphoribosyltransferase [bacterium]|nr:orotate phosphoribosyltransferase [bacterium]
MPEKDILQRLTETEAMLEGHFLLSSGLHSNKYIQCAKLLQYPDNATWVGEKLAEKVSVDGIELVVSPAIGGIVIGQEVAKALGVPHIFVEKVNGTPTLRRGFSVKPGAKILVVEDVITTGKSTKEVIDVIDGTGGKVVAFSAMVDRGGSANIKLPFAALLKLDIEVFQPNDCPLCKSGIPVVKPGSRIQKK